MFGGYFKLFFKENEYEFFMRVLRFISFYGFFVEDKYGLA